MRGQTTPDEKREAFLKAFAQCGNATQACAAVGISRRTCYEWRQSDAAFAEAWADMVEAAHDRLEDEAWRRAVEGVERPIFHRGTVIGHTRTYSDSLLKTLLQRRRPEVYGRTRAGEGPRKTEDKVEVVVRKLCEEEGEEATVAPPSPGRWPVPDTRTVMDDEYEGVD
jgi:hypothetical protein